MHLVTIAELGWCACNWCLLYTKNGVYFHDAYSLTLGTALNRKRDFVAEPNSPNSSKIRIIEAVQSLPDNPVVKTRVYLPWGTKHRRITRLHYTSVIYTLSADIQLQKVTKDNGKVPYIDTCITTSLFSIRFWKINGYITVQIAYLCPQLTSKQYIFTVRNWILKFRRYAGES